jgi:hypothetical protein
MARGREQGSKGGIKGSRDQGIKEKNARKPGSEGAREERSKEENARNQPIGPAPPRSLDPSDPLIPSAAGLRNRRRAARMDSCIAGCCPYNPAAKSAAWPAGRVDRVPGRGCPDALCGLKELLVSTMTKVFVVLTAVLSIVLSCLTVATAARWSNQKEQIKSYQDLYAAEQVNRVNAQAVMATSLAMKDDALKDAQRSLENLQQEFSATTNSLAELRIDLARQTNDRVAAEAGRKKLEEILDVQTRELTAAQAQNQQLQTQNIDLQTRNQRVNSRLLETTSQLTIAHDENRNLQEKLYAEQQRTKELQQASAAPRRVTAAEPPPPGVQPVAAPVKGPIEGEIVEVDGRYVSLNVGETSGVVPGMSFMVYRGESYVGDLEIENVRPKESGGKLTMVAPGQSVQRGDRVAYGYGR